MKKKNDLKREMTTLEAMTRILIAVGFIVISTILGMHIELLKENLNKDNSITLIFIFIVSIVSVMIVYPVIYYLINKDETGLKNLR